MITDETPSFHFKPTASSSSKNSENEYPTLCETVKHCDILESVPEDTLKEENVYECEAKATNNDKYENSQENLTRYKRIVSLMSHLDAPDIGKY